MKQLELNLYDMLTPQGMSTMEAILIGMGKKSGEFSCLATDTLADLHATGELTRVVPRVR